MGEGIMQGKKSLDQKLFYGVTLDKLVPQDHIIRKLDQALDLNFLYEETKIYYSHEGKPSIDPVVLFKIYVLGYFFGIFSERQLFRDIQVNLAYRWYIGYDLDEDIPHHSIMTKSRYRFPRGVFERLFKHIIHLCKEKGLISGDYYFIDSSIVRANASKDSFRMKLKSESEFLGEFDENDNTLTKFQGHVFDGNVDPNKMGKRRHRVKKSDQYKSKSDPDAEILTRPGKGTHPSYKSHFCVDRKNRVILAVDGSKASDDDMSKVHDLYTHSIFAAGKKPTIIIADSHYGGIECLKYFQDQNVNTCIYPRLSNTLKGKFINTDFKVKNNGNEATCPAGHGFYKKVKHRYRIQYRWSKKTCNKCHLKNKCTETNNGRIVSFYQGSYFSDAISLVESSYGKKLLRARQIIVEGVIGEAKTQHLLNRCKYRRLDKFKIQLLMTGSVINLKRLLKVTGNNKKTKSNFVQSCEMKNSNFGEYHF